MAVHVVPVSTSAKPTCTGVPTGVSVEVASPTAVHDPTPAHEIPVMVSVDHDPTAGGGGAGNKAAVQSPPGPRVATIGCALGVGCGLVPWF